MYFFVLALIIHIFVNEGEHVEASHESLFPYLNLTSITMINDEGRLVKGYFTRAPGSRSAADVENQMKGIQYTLYTRKHHAGTKVKNAEELKTTSFDSNKKTKLITHGWLSSGTADTCMEIKDGYLSNYDVNVIVMDWAVIANDYFYIFPMRSVPKVAHHYAILINDMIDSLGVDPDDIHLIGHSLGAQISGLVWKDMDGKKPGRVTGLDPAFPGFDHKLMFNERISNESASFVDIIHSCGGLLGIFDPIGHADFYPNGGVGLQPGCESFSAAMEACSHGRSWKFFAESVQYPNRKFYAVKCEDWGHFTINQCDKNDRVVMGEQVTLTARGQYFLRTNSRKPFSLIDKE